MPISSDNPQRPIISIQQATKSFGERRVLNSLSLDIFAGELTVLIGPSGCGKSTLLRCLNGLESIDSGKIQIQNILLEPREQIGVSDFEKRSLSLRQSVGMVFQSYHLFPHMNVIDNLVRPQMIVKKIDRSQATQKAEVLLEKVGLTSQRNQHPSELSGGQQQRACIARALAMDPTILLYDEPTSALDPSLVNEVLQVMKTLDQEGMTQLVVTHEMRFAKDAADKVILIDSGEIVESGTPDVFFSDPRDNRTKNFLRYFL